VPIQGPLKELGLHDVFQLLDLSRKTGVLRITSELRNNEGTVFFDHGAIVFATARSKAQRIGERLVQAGKITPAELEHARAVQQREGGRRRLGRIFVEIGALTPRELEHEVERQVEEEVFELLSWREGFFAFTEGPVDGAPADALVRVPTEKVLMEGARRIDEWSRIEAQVPHLGVIPSLAPLEAAGGGTAPLLDLRPAEWAVLAEVDGARDLRQIAMALHLPEFDVSRTVFGLVSTGVVVLRDPAGRASRADAGGDAEALLAAAEVRLESGDAAAAREAARAALALRPEEPRGHLALGRAHLAEGRFGEAVEECRRAIRLAPDLADAYRWCGFALAASGRFREARENWERWQQLADGAVSAEQRREVTDAVAAAASLERLLGGDRA
jgi:tetratricopeptide (TPR) repeat protein